MIKVTRLSSNIFQYGRANVVHRVNAHAKMRDMWVNVPNQLDDEVVKVHVHQDCDYVPEHVY